MATIGSAKLLPLVLPAEGIPPVAQLFYQPVTGSTRATADVLASLRKRALSQSIDGQALELATTLRDLAALGVGATDESLLGPGGLTPLHLAVEADQPRTLAVLIDSGCDVNARNRVGDTPAHVAARGGRAACVRLLGSPRALANFELVDAEGRTAAEVRLGFRGGAVGVAPCPLPRCQMGSAETPPPLPATDATANWQSQTPLK